MLLNHPFNDGINSATLVGVDDRRAFDLNGSDTFIGRSKENDISLIADLSLSRRHAAITKVDGVYYLRDLRSSNGTLLNGKTVDGMVALQPDDEIFLGRSRFLFCPSSAKLESTESYVSNERTVFLGKVKPTFVTRTSNLMLRLKRLLFAAQPCSLTALTPSIQRLRASHHDELLRGIQR
jgi:pSer/pThr/pTyr-binding forkhead associated (FHA) protein